MWNTDVRRPGNARVGELAAVKWLINCWKRFLTQINLSLNRKDNYHINRSFHVLMCPCSASSPERLGDVLFWNNCFSLVTIYLLFFRGSWFVPQHNHICAILSCDQWGGSPLGVPRHCPRIMYVCILLYGFYIWCLYMYIICIQVYESRLVVWCHIAPFNPYHAANNS